MEDMKLSSRRAFFKCLPLGTGSVSGTKEGKEITGISISGGVLVLLLLEFHRLTRMESLQFPCPPPLHCVELSLT